MHRLLTKPLPYREDSADLFDRIAGLRGAVFLDSGRPRSDLGRFDVLAALPRTWIDSRDGITAVHVAGEVRRYKDQDPFSVIRDQIEPLQTSQAYPFVTGAIGYFAYDLGRRIECLPDIAASEEHLPELALGIYDWAVIVDHRACQSTLVGWRGTRSSEDAFDSACAIFEANAASRASRPVRALGPVRSDMSKRDYLEKFSQVQQYIRAGDCYQVNLAQRFSVDVSGDSWDLYRRLRAINPAPFSAYLDCGEFQVLSHSPEQFLRVRAGHVETRPIKGTRPRSGIAKQDFEAIEALRDSAKDRAENLMIVDLLRNDISKNCRAGSVKVSRLFDVVSFTSVHHMVSTIEGELEAGKDALDLLRGCFPGGSITGAPKIRSMEIIEELEPCRRGVYCGCIGYIGRDGDMDMNIAIRTAVRHGERLAFFAGGGLVSDSDGEAEYQETLDKVAPILDLFGAPKE